MKILKNILDAFQWIYLSLLAVPIGMYFYSVSYNKLKIFLDSQLLDGWTNLVGIIITYIILGIIIKLFSVLINNYLTLEEKYLSQKSKLLDLENHYCQLKIEMPVKESSFKKINYLFKCFVEKYPSVFCVQLYSYTEYNDDKHTIVDFNHTEFAFCRPRHQVNSVNETYKIRIDLVNEYNEMLKIIENNPDSKEISDYLAILMKRIKNTSSSIDDSKIFIYAVILIILNENLSSGKSVSLLDIPIELL